MFLKIFKPYTPSTRNKKSITSSLSSLNTHISTQKVFFRHKINGKHKFLTKTNSVYTLNFLKNSLLGSFIIFNWIKVSYTNRFLNFCFFDNNSVVIRPAKYGFSFDKIYTSYFISPFILNKKRNVDGLSKYYYTNVYNFLFFSNTNTIFFFVCNYFSKKIFAKSPGTFCLYLNFDKNSCLLLLKLPSKSKILFDKFVIGFFGRNSNIFSKYSFFSSFKQKLKIKKHSVSVRGIAQNPVDHPNGGSSKTKRPLKTPWGLVAKNSK